ncbi:hypothetical protein [Pseudonocardia charpentierae]|uniref:Uncharacterized protein n=1 Tax=Pseudonocardia charpentierae TaxID=3075545 RepID=A0ABU2NJH4_9PSEU|nr:hypothetical protein [Pseudonocardia sp. DSM 45834]MDT0353727.1 hypothetical protein [Pseudonocardia sp. DSM 45834]
MLRQWRGADDPAVIEAQRDLAALKIENFIAKITESHPTLDPARVERLVSVLRGASGGGTA